MSNTRMVLLTVAGSVVGLMLGGGVVAGPIVGPNYQRIIWGQDWEPLIFLMFGVPPIALGTVIGAAAGAAIMRRILRQKSSFWKALEGTMRGLLYGFLLALLVGIILEGTSQLVVISLIVCTSMVAGAVIGSGWKAKPADTAKVES